MWVGVSVCVRTRVCKRFVLSKGSTAVRADGPTPVLQMSIP